MMLNTNQNKLVEFVNFLQSRDSSKATIKSYSRTLSSFFEAFNKPYTTTKQVDVVAFIGGLERRIVPKSKQWERPREALSSATKQSIYCALSSFFRYCKNYELEKDIKDLRKKGSRRGSKLPVKITEREILAMIETDVSRSVDLNARNRLIVQFFYATGVRNGELRRILIKDLPLGVTPLPNTHVVTLVGKGNFMRRIVLPKWLLVKAKEFFEKHHRGISPYLFYSKKGEQLSGTQVWMIVKAKARLANVPEEKINSVVYNGVAAFPHELRSTFATTLSEQGENLLHIQTLLGHASPSTTQRYVRVSDSELQKAKLPKNPEKEG